MDICFWGPTKIKSFVGFFALLVVFLVAKWRNFAPKTKQTNKQTKTLFKIVKEVPDKHGTEDENAKRFALLEGKFPPQHEKKKKRLYLRQPKGRSSSTTTTTKLGFKRRR
jgi:hypothetical protein